MNTRREARTLVGGLLVFVALYHLPVGNARFDGAVHEALALTRWYAREHVLLCLVPAFFIAGAISVFVSQAAVMKYLGAGAKKWVAYSVASVAGTVLAVCSCTVLPLFAGIYGMGAGLGPATAFLYSGPAVNALAIILTARVLGTDIGLARAIGAIVFSVVIGLLMHLIFRRGNRPAIKAADMPAEAARPLYQTATTFLTLVAILIFANWGGGGTGVFATIFRVKWWLVGGSALGLFATLVAWQGLPWWKVALAAAAGAAAWVWPGGPVSAFTAVTVVFTWAIASEGGALGEWCDASWGFAKQILPLLLAGVLVAGLLLGRPDHEGLIPSRWVASLVGGNSFGANLFAAVSGAFMYFATLTEVPILSGLMGAGMGKGPALTLLLAGPAVSLPSILVLRTIIGGRKTATFIGLVIILSAVTGFAFGAWR